jgi:hypothetical protein
VRELLNEVKHNGYDRVRIETETSLEDPNNSNQTNDIVDICRLTCLEQGIRISQDLSDPTLVVHGVKVTLRMEVPA